MVIGPAVMVEIPQLFIISLGFLQLFPALSRARHLPVLYCNWSALFLLELVIRPVQTIPGNQKIPPHGMIGAGGEFIFPGKKFPGWKGCNSFSSDKTNKSDYRRCSTVNTGWNFFDILVGEIGG